jgi:hypothetical protein
LYNFIKYLVFSGFLTSFSAISFAQKDLENISAVEDLKQYVYANAPHEDAFVAVQRLASPSIDKKEWQSAVKVFLKYLEWFPEMRSRFDLIIELLKTSSQNLITTNISYINTEYDEYFPVLSVDGKKMYFTGSGRKDCFGGEDIFVSDFVGGVWQNAKNLGYPFSWKDDDAINSVSADGNVMILFGNYKGALGGGDNFYTEKTSSGWSNIKPFPYPVNSKYWDCDGYLTADGKAFLFTSDRPGGVGELHKGGEFFHGIYEGNTDIYICTKNDSG